MTNIEVKTVKAHLRLPWRLRFKLWRHRRQFDKAMRKAGLSPATLQQALERAFFWGTDEAAEWAVQREAELRALAYTHYRMRLGGKALGRAVHQFGEAMQAFNEGVAEGKGEQ